MPKTTPLIAATATAVHADVDTALLSDDDRAVLALHVETVRAFQKQSIEAAVSLAVILDRKLYLEAGSFEMFALGEFGIRRRRAYQLAAAGRIYGELRDAGVDPLPRNEGQIRPLVDLDQASRRAVWEQVVDHAKGDSRRVTGASVELAVLTAAGSHGREELPTDLALAAVEQAAAGGPTPTDEIHNAYQEMLGSLDPDDQANVWSRVSAGVLRNDDGRISAVPRSEAKKALVALAEDQPEDVADRGPADPDGFCVLIERELLSAATDGQASTGIDAAGGPQYSVVARVVANAPKVGISYLLPYKGAELAVVELVRALDAEEDPADAREKMHLDGRRQLTRCRLAPELAAWTWTVLAPAPRRSARSWFPEPDATPPCYVPARLQQPKRTRPKKLDLRLPTAWTVLVAPGVDLLRDDVPDEVVLDVLACAEAAPHLLFLAATNHADRIAGTAWPPNVRPALKAVCPPKPPTKDESRKQPVAPAEVTEALGAFEAAGCRGILVLDEFWAPLEADLVRRARDHVFAVVLRGGTTSQAVYDQALALRDVGVHLVSASNVRRRPWDALHEAVAETEQPVRAHVRASLPITPLAPESSPPQPKP